MYYVTCSGCGRFVMSGNQCSHCLTENKQELPQRESYGRSRPPSPSTLPIVAGFVAAGLTYLKTTEPVSSAIVGGAIGLRSTVAFSESARWGHHNPPPRYR